jgi:hypothetical protein
METLAAMNFCYLSKRLYSVLFHSVRGITIKMFMAHKLKAPPEEWGVSLEVKTNYCS